MAPDLKKIFFTGRQTLFDKDGLILPRFNLMSKLFRSQGYLITSDKHADYLIMLDHFPRKFSDWTPTSSEKSKSILIQMETDPILPQQNKVYNLYEVVIKIGRQKPERSLNQKFYFVNLPYIPLENPAQSGTSTSRKFFEKDQKSYSEWLTRKIEVSLIAMNKFANGKSNLYNLRRKVVKKYGQSVLQVYGYYWDGFSRQTIINRIGFIKNSVLSFTNPQIILIIKDLFTFYPSNISAVEDKFDILFKSKYNLIIENSTTTITEKFFDALWAGCIPIYVGPSLDSFKLPSSAAIEISPKQLLSEFHQIITFNHNEEEILQCGKDFINSTEFTQNWGYESVFRKIVEKCTDVFDG